MLAPYRALLAVRGGAAFSAAGLLARMPISMQTLGTVLLVSATTGSYGLAGAVSATVALAQALVSPLVSRLVDRLGQARVMVPALAAHVAGLAALVGLVLAEAPSWTLFPAAALFGAAYPPVGSLVRARWAHAVGRSGLLPAAYSWESALDEVIFVVGPILVTVLATGIAPAAGLLVAGAFAGLGGLLLAGLRRTEPPAHATTGGRSVSAARISGVRVLALVSLALGGIFGSAEVIVVAFAAERDRPAAAGVVLALLAGGSLIAGLAYGAVRWRASLRRRFLIGVTALAAATLTLPLAPNLPALGVVMFLSGFAISPALIAAFGLVEELVPAGALTEGLTWLATGINIGLALSASVSGQVIDAVGARPAFAVTVGCGIAAVVLAVAGARWLGPPGEKPDAGATEPSLSPPGGTIPG
jgi:MFS family permease